MSESYKKKLIEVALPLDIINEANSKEKNVRHGNISTMHLWWSRKPLAACKAVLFASIIDDPSNYLPEKDAEKERKKLFKLIAELVEWKNPRAKEAFAKANSLIKTYSKNSTLQVLDPFVGGGSIPLAAQYLGLEGYGIDVNPVAVLISRCLVELPLKYKDRPPVNKSAKLSTNGWTGPKGLTEDIRYYGKRLNDKVYQKIGDKFTSNGNSETVIAWLWCRSVKCPNPACGYDIPLLTNNYIKKKSGNFVYVVPKIENRKIVFNLHTSKHLEEKLTKGTSAGRASFRCINPSCETPIKGDYIDNIATKNEMKYLGMAVVTEGDRARNYRPFTEKDLAAANQIDRLKILESDNIPNQKCEGTFASNAKGRRYGFKTFSDYFSTRQLLLMSTFIGELSSIRKEIVNDSKDEEYANIVLTYLAIVISKSADYYNSLTYWNNQGEKIEHLFGNQGINMAWNYAEANPFSNSSKNFLASLELTAESLDELPAGPQGEIKNLDSMQYLDFEKMNPIISTDPPYYDNICYSKLADYFYVWLRLMLKKLYSDLFSTVLTPKDCELTADKNRFEGDESKAQTQFTEGIQKAFLNINQRANKEFPITIFYAFKQTETDRSSDEDLYASTGWETMLTGLINANLRIVGTWPMRTERYLRPASIGSNSLSSSIVIVCRSKPEHAPISTRREFINALKKELPPALANLQEAGIAPVDMAQSVIGPGMAVFSKYSKVIEADGRKMTVRTALQIINQELDAYFTEQESEMDKETRFCIAWYEQFGWKDASFGLAEGLMKAQNTAVNSLEAAGIVIAKGGKVRLVKRDELEQNWDPTTDKKLTVWECVQYLVKSLEDKGESGAAEIIKKIGGLSEPVKELAYRLYAIAEKKGWIEDGLAYNNIISSWQSIADKAQFGEISESKKKNLKDKAQRTLDDL